MSDDSSFEGSSRIEVFITLYLIANICRVKESSVNIV